MRTLLMAFGIVFDMREGADMANDTKIFRFFIQMWTNKAYRVRCIQYTIVYNYSSVCMASNMKPIPIFKFKQY